MQKTLKNIKRNLGYIFNTDCSRYMGELINTFKFN